MDNSELIRNVALAGHLHTGKVRSTVLFDFAIWLLFFVCVSCSVDNKKKLLICSLLVLLTVCFCGLPG